MLVLLRSKKGIPLWQGDGEFSTSRQLGNHYRYQSLPRSITQKRGSLVRNLKQGTPRSLWVSFTWIGTSRQCLKVRRYYDVDIVGFATVSGGQLISPSIVLLKQNP